VILVGKIAKVQGLKGELILYATTDHPSLLPHRHGLVLGPPNVDWSDVSPDHRAIPCQVANVREQKNKPCIRFNGFDDRTSVEPFVGMSLWMPEDQVSLSPGESFRHEWVGLPVTLSNGSIVGHVLRLESTPMGYDMVVVQPEQSKSTLLIPYIKKWWKVDLSQRLLEVDPPEGLVDQSLDE
jgi:16S rRNA processing protein RimM